MTSAAAGTLTRGPDAGDWGPLLRGELRAGRILVRVPVAAAIATVLAGAICAPMALAGIWRPAVALPVVLVTAAVGIRASGAVWVRPVPPWVLVACAVVAIGAGVWAGATHDQHVVIRRDAGSYAQYGEQLAVHHRLPVNVHAQALGGARVLDDPDVTVGSPAYYEVGHGDSTEVVPQFVVAFPAWLSVGRWLGGWTGLLLMPALFAALGLLGVGALTAATVGPRWAPVTTLATAVTQPMLHAARSTYSEPPALLALAAGLTLVACATEAGGRGREDRARPMALVAGLLLGGSGLIRIDALRECVLIVPLVVLFAVRRHCAARPLGIGLAVGLVVSAVIDLVLSRPYVESIDDSLVPLAALGVLLAVAGAGVVVAARRRPKPIAIERDRDRVGHEPSGMWRALPWLLVAAVVVTAVVLTSRPMWQTPHQDPSLPSTPDIASLQRHEGLTVDGSRTYAEHTVTWVLWWIGPAAAVLAVAGAAMAAYVSGRMLARGSRIPSWTGPFLVALGSIVLTLWRPGITPDHPWADRRLVVDVLPGMLLLATAAVAGLVRLARRRASGPLLALAVLVGIGALVGPALAATVPVATLRTEMGEVSAVHQVCQTFRPRQVAVLVGPRAANEWPQVLRSDCGVPSLVVQVPGSDTTTSVGRQQLAQALARILPGIRAAGSTPVLVSDRQDLLQALGTDPVQLTDLVTREDPRLLTRRPEGYERLVIELWAAPAPG